MAFGRVGVMRGGRASPRAVEQVCFGEMAGQFDRAYKGLRSQRIAGTRSLPTQGADRSRGPSSVSFLLASGRLTRYSIRT